jgi:hypothetical protein
VDGDVPVAAGDDVMMRRRSGTSTRCTIDEVVARIRDGGHGYLVFAVVSS